MCCKATQSIKIDTLDCFLTFKRSILSSTFENRVKTARVVSNLSEEIQKSKNLASPFLYWNGTATKGRKENVDGIWIFSTDLKRSCKDEKSVGRDWKSKPMRKGRKPRLNAISIVWGRRYNCAQSLLVDGIWNLSTDLKRSWKDEKSIGHRVSKPMRKNRKSKFQIFENLKNFEN